MRRSSGSHALSFCPVHKTSAATPGFDDGWRLGYQAIAALQLTLATAFLFSLRLWAKAPEVKSGLAPAHRGASALESRVTPQVGPAALRLAPFLFFLYAAVEVGTSLWAATILIEQRQLGSGTASVWVSCFFAAIMAGRFATGVVSTRWGNRRLVRYGLLVALVGALLVSVGTYALTVPPGLALAGLMLLGLGCAPIYPSLMHEAAQRFDAVTAQRVIGRQVGSAYIGCMLVPAALGVVGAHAGVGFIMPLIALFALALLACSAWLDRIT